MSDPTGCGRHVDNWFRDALGFNVTLFTFTLLYEDVLEAKEPRPHCVGAAGRMLAGLNRFAELVQLADPGSEKETATIAATKIALARLDALEGAAGTGRVP
jgi:hypothetical protein